MWHGFTQMAAYAANAPIVVDRAEGRELIDVEGHRYLDAISSLWVTTLGHRVPQLDQAVRDQLDRVAHSTALGNGNTVVVELAEALAAVVPVDRPHLLFASDGAAAVEQALKIAFQFWTNQGVAGRNTYLAFGGAYHGDTVGSLAVGDGGFGTTVFDPLRFPVLRCPAGDAAAAVAMIEAHRDELAAVVLEPLVQGAAGIALNSPAFVRAVADACHRCDVLLVCDEVATGFGRTGTLFAVEQCEVRPDLLCLGKGITGGYLPLSATVAAGRVFDAFLGEDLSERTLYHGHSYSGNALAAAVALRHLQLFEERGVLANVADRSAQLAARLEADVAGHPGVKEVRQHGLMVGIELDPPADGLRWGRRVSAGCVRRGVLLRPLGDVVVLMPILTSTPEEIDRIVDVVVASLAEVLAHPVEAAPGSRSLERPSGSEAVVSGDWPARVEGRLEAVRAAGRWRSIRTLDGTGPRFRLDDRSVVSFASNDYLGLTAHPAVLAAAHAAIDRWGTGAGASRLVVGARPVHAELESALAAWKGTEAALLFPTGYAANVGVLTALADAPEVLVVSDELNHASIIDGARLAKGRVAVARHADVDHVAALLAAHDGPALVVTDSVFSMDGDEAPVAELAAACEAQGALLVLDEAHAVLGPALPAGVDPARVVRVGTLSKALGSLGGFVAGPRSIIDLLVNVARPFIFSTAPSPVDAAAGLAAVGVLRSAEGAELIARLRRHVESIRPGHPSPIVPVVLGDEDAAVKASLALLELGILVPAIRPPTVPAGTSRLRVALSAAHTDAEVEHLRAALTAL